MDIKNLFKRGKKISKYAFRENYVKSKTTQGFLENEKVAEIFDRRAEKAELNKAMLEKSKGGLTKTEMKEVIGGLETLTEKERYKFAKLVFPSAPSGERFIRTKQTSKTPSDAGNATTYERKSANTPVKNKQMTPSKMASIMNRIRTNSVNSSENTEGENTKGNFSQALAAMRKNKRG